MLLLLAALHVHASPAELDLVPLKSGAFVHLQASVDGRPGRIGFIEPREDGGSTVILCPVADAARWRSWSDYFAAIGAEGLPTRVLASEPESCGSTAAWGIEEKTRNVVQLSVKGTSGSLDTTIGRREAVVLSERLRGFVERAATAPAVPGGSSQGFEAALRLLYLARGWSLRADDPGYQADLAAVQAAALRGADVAALLHKVWSDRRLRPGALADLAAGP